VDNVIRTIRELEDVKRVIKGLEAESVGRRKMMRYGSLSDLQRTNCEFHLQLNAEIVVTLGQFLLTPGG